MTREEYDALPWKRDAVARRWADLYFDIIHTVNRAGFRNLCLALGYCETWRTPFGDEILKRCGKTQAEIDFLRRDAEHYRAAVRRACAGRGISIG